MKQLLITGHPGNLKWMADYVGKTAQVTEVHTLYKVNVGGDEFWIGECQGRRSSMTNQEIILRKRRNRELDHVDDVLLRVYEARIGEDDFPSQEAIMSALDTVRRLRTARPQNWRPKNFGDREA